jgi:hypothetical protein
MNDKQEADMLNEKYNKQWAIEAFLSRGIAANRKKAEAAISGYNMPEARKNLADFQNVLWCVRNLEKNYGEEKNISEAVRLVGVVYRWELAHWRPGTKYWKAI